MKNLYIFALNVLLITAGVWMIQIATDIDHYIVKVGTMIMGSIAIMTAGMLTTLLRRG